MDTRYPFINNNAMAYGAQGISNPYGAQPMGFQPQYQQQVQMPMQQAQVTPQAQTNKIFVTSVEDALTRTANPNSEMCYLHQDKPMLIEIRTDGQGRKTAFEYDLSPHQEVQTKEEPKVDYISREEFNKECGKLYDQMKKMRKTLDNFATRRNKYEPTK